MGVGILFGPERTGLENEDVALASTIITFPVNLPSRKTSAVLPVSSRRWLRVRMTSFEICSRRSSSSRSSSSLKRRP
jgi:hypothetical protein